MIKFLSDLAWAYRIFRIKRFRDTLIFSRRKMFDDRLRRRSVHGESWLGVVCYPDAFYMITDEIFTSAKSERGEEGKVTK